MSTPGSTPSSPWTVTLAWVPGQNFGAVSVMPGRAPVTAIVGRLRAGEPVGDVAADYAISVEEVEVLWRLAQDLREEP